MRPPMKQHTCSYCCQPLIGQFRFGRSLSCSKTCQRRNKSGVPGRGSSLYVPTYHWSMLPDVTR